MSEPPLVLVARMEGERYIEMEITADLVATACDLGWQEVMRSTDIEPGTNEIDPSQSNPRRVVDHGEQ